MHRIDGAGHVDHLFVAEDPATLRPPTEITPEIMNAFQEELATFIEWALGAESLNKGDNTQLKQGLLAKFASLTLVGNAGGSKNLGASATLLASDAGKEIVISGAGGVVATLPPIASAPIGAMFYFTNIGSGVSSVARQGADKIDKGGATATSVSLGIGDSLIVVSNGAYWNLVGGSAALSFAAIFGSSLAVNGWKKYPDPSSPTGFFIEQWGVYTYTTTTAATLNSFSLPIAFPNSILWGICSPTDVSGSGVGARAQYGPTSTASQFKFNQSASGVYSNSIIWRAIGY